MTTRIEISEQHLGQDADEQDVEAVIEALREAGYDARRSETPAAWPSNERANIEAIIDATFAEMDRAQVAAPWPSLPTEQGVAASDEIGRLLDGETTEVVVDC